MRGINCTKFGDQQFHVVFRYFRYLAPFRNEGGLKGSGRKLMQTFVLFALSRVKIRGSIRCGRDVYISEKISANPSYVKSVRKMAAEPRLEVW